LFGPAESILAFLSANSAEYLPRRELVRKTKNQNETPNERRTNNATESVRGEFRSPSRINPGSMEA
jgi:hypothetical protein